MRKNKLFKNYIIEITNFIIKIVIKKKFLDVNDTLEINM